MHIDMYVIKHHNIIQSDMPSHIREMAIMHYNAQRKHTTHLEGRSSQCGNGSRRVSCNFRLHFTS